MFKGMSCGMAFRCVLTVVVALVVARASAVPYKLGVAGYTFHAQTLNQALSNMRTNDCHYICHKADFLPYDADAAAIADFKRSLSAFGVNALASGPLYAKDEVALRQQFEFARRYGLKVIVGVPYEDVKSGDWSDRVESERMLDAVGTLVKEFDIRYAIHNHGPDIPRLFPTAESVLSRVGNRDRRIGVCLDIGHECRAGLDPVAFIRAHPDRIFDVHLKNIRIDAKENIAMPGPRGELKVFDILLALAEVGYSGVCHIEYERDFHDNVRGLAESIGYYRGCIDAIDRILSVRGEKLMRFGCLKETDLRIESGSK